MEEKQNNKKMYNCERKSAFIGSYTSRNSTTAHIRRLFTLLKPYESQWGDDLCMQTTETLEPVLNKISGIRTSGMNLTLSALRSYVEWCKEQGYQTSDGIYGVEIDPQERMGDKMVASPLHLKVILDESFDRPELETVHCVYRSFLWLAFAGLDDLDALEIRASDIDFYDMVVRHDGHEFEIYKEGKLDLENACNLTEFNYIHPFYETVRERADGDRVVRGFRSKRMNITVLRERVSRKFKDTEHKISYSRVQLSGHFYRVYERERAGMQVSFTDVVRQNMKKKNYKLSKTINKNKIANILERQYIADY